MKKAKRPHGRVIDFQKVKNEKKNARRRLLWLAAVVGLLLLLGIGALVGHQIYQVVSPDSDFWGNFGPSASQQQSAPA